MSIATYIESISDSRVWYIDEAYGLSKRQEYAALLQSSGVKEAAELYGKSFRLENGAFSDTGEKLKPSQVAEMTNDYVVFKLSGVMLSEAGLCEAGIEELTNPILAAAKNPNIKKAKLRIDSGGGELGAALKLFSALETFVASGKEIIGVVDGVMASGAVLGTLPIKKIYASSEFSQIGSIGVMLTIPKKNIEYQQKELVTVFSSLSPDKQGEIRELVEEGKTEKIVEKLDSIALLFHNKVLAYRDIPPELKDKALRGGMFMADEAMKMGLIQAQLFNSHNDNIMFKEFLALFNEKFGATLNENSDKAAIEAAMSQISTDADIDAKIKAAVEATDFSSLLAESVTNAVKAANDSESTKASLKALVAEEVKANAVDLSVINATISDLTTKVTGLLEKSTGASGGQNPKPGETVKEKVEFETGEVQFTGKY